MTAQAKIDILTYAPGLETYCTTFADLLSYSPFLFYLHVIRTKSKKLKRRRYKRNKNEGKVVIKCEYVTIQVKCTECNTSGAFSVIVPMFLNS